MKVSRACRMPRVTRSPCSFPTSNTPASTASLARPAVRVVGSLPAGVHACGAGFAVQLSLPAQGSDNAFRLGEDARDCAPTASADGARADSDTLTLRHASQNTAAPRAGRLQVYSQSLASAGPLLLFGDGRAPGPVDPGPCRSGSGGAHLLRREQLGGSAGLARAAREGADRITRRRTISRRGTPARRRRPAGGDRRRNRRRSTAPGACTSSHRIRRACAKARWWRSDCGCGFLQTSPNPGSTTAAR